MKGVLIVEDSPEDFQTIQRLMEDEGIAGSIVHCENGKQALLLIERLRPDSIGIIILDLNLPQVDGLTVLKKLKNDERTKKIPVIVMSSSAGTGDVDRAYAEGANSYIKKPFSLEEFRKKIKVLINYWLRTAILPSRFAE
jgi:two-component system response regulator